MVAPATTVGTLPTEPKRIGYSFGGWNTHKNGSGSSFGANTTVRGNTTVYAVWTEEFYQLTFLLNGGYGTVPQVQSLHLGEKATVVALPQRDGYTFTAWNTAADGSGYNWNFDTNTMPADHVTLYAQWKQTVAPTTNPTAAPTTNPTAAPTARPTARPTANPSTTPSATPTANPSTMPSADPSVSPDVSPTADPNTTPTDGNNENNNTAAAGAVANDQNTGTGNGAQTQPSASPTIKIGDQEIPLFGNSAGNVWALLNLVFMISGCILAVMIGLTAIMRNKKYKADINNMYIDSPAMRAYSKMGLICTMLLAVVCLCAFVFTQNISSKMVIIDQWTVLFAILLASQIICSIWTLHQKKENYVPAT